MVVEVLGLSKLSVVDLLRVNGKFLDPTCHRAFDVVAALFNCDMLNQMSLVIERAWLPPISFPCG